MDVKGNDAWFTVSQTVRWFLCPLALPIGLYLGWELTALTVFGGRYSGEILSASAKGPMLSPVFGATSAALSIGLAMLVAPSNRSEVGWIMFGVGGTIAAFVFIVLGEATYEASVWPAVLATYAAGAMTGLGLPWYVRRYEMRHGGIDPHTLPPQLPDWAEWAAAFASALIAAGAIYAACLFIVFDSVWVYREDALFVRRGHPEAITGALSASAWVACGSLAAPARRVWVPFILLGAEALPIAWILAVAGSVSHWSPPMTDFLAAAGGVGLVTAGMLSVLLALRSRGRPPVNAT